VARRSGGYLSICRQLPGASFECLTTPQLWMLRIPPANQVEVLRGHRKGQYSIRINGQWRICFRWKSGEAYDVEIVDYH
jgi:plasmid maintenance system killer protein